MDKGKSEKSRSLCGRETERGRPRTGGRRDMSSTADDQHANRSRSCYGMGSETDAEYISRDDAEEEGADGESWRRRKR